MKSELFKKLKLYRAMHPEQFEALTENEFWAKMETKKRRNENGNFGNGSMYYQYIDDLCI